MPWSLWCCCPSSPRPAAPDPRANPTPEPTPEATTEATGARREVVAEAAIEPTRWSELCLETGGTRKPFTLEAAERRDLLAQQGDLGIGIGRIAVHGNDRRHTELR